MMSSHIRNETISSAWYRNLRRSPRARINMEVKIWHQVDGEKQMFLGRSRDISEYGIAAQVAANLEIDEKVELQFTLPGSVNEITVKATVCAAGEHQYGFEFNGIDPLMKRMLGALVKM